MMTTKRNIVAASILAIGLTGVGVAPSLAGEGAIRLETQRLDRTTAEFSQYRGYGRGWHGARGWRGGSRGAAVAGAVGLGILGAAAAAAASNAYAAPGYYDAPAYGYGAYPVYDEPVVVYRPQRYYRDERDYGRGPYAGTYRGAPDPARGGR